MAAPVLDLALDLHYSHPMWRFNSRGLLLVCLLCILVQVSSAYAGYPKRHFLTPLGRKVAGVTGLSCVLLLGDVAAYKNRERIASFAIDRWNLVVETHDVKVMGARNSFAVPSEIVFDPMSVAGREKYSSIMPSVLNRYPKPVLQKVLRRVYLGQKLTVDKTVVGGVAFTDSVVLSELSNDEHWIRYQAHHEIAHNLLATYGDLFPTDEWNALLPKDFKYFGSGLAMQKKGVPKLNDAELMQLRQRGFLIPYSEASLHEDVAVLQGELMSGNPDLLVLEKAYPLLAAKLALIREFLNRIDPEILK